MTTNTITKPSSRVQIAFNATDGLNSRIQNLYQKYYGLSLTEIVKLAIIQLDKSTEFEDETAYIKSDPKLYARLLESINNPIIAKSYNSVEELEKEFKSM
jgi:hypothetical protein